MTNKGTSNKENWVGGAMDKSAFKEVLTGYLNSIMDYCNIEKTDVNFKETAERIFRMYTEELLRGYHDNPKNYIKVFDGVASTNQLIIVDNIPVKSICSHHLLPFWGLAKITVKYKTGASVLGLSKYYRIVDHFSRKLQLQEKLTEEIADFLEENLDLEGITIEIEALHTCVGLRGVNSFDNKVKTISNRGCLK